MTPRSRDLATLRALLATEFLGDQEREAFEGMLAAIDGPDARYPDLTAKQRAWAEGMAARLELDDVDDPAERNRGVPRGKEVEPAAALAHRPLRPPTRRAPR